MKPRVGGALCLLGSDLMDLEPHHFSGGGGMSRPPATRSTPGSGTISERLRVRLEHFAIHDAAYGK